jgi:hypothetical protein
VGLRSEHPDGGRQDVRSVETAQRQELQPHQPALPLRRCSRNLEDLQDAEEEGDQELVDFFSAALENNLEASQRAKELLAARLERERE